MDAAYPSRILITGYTGFVGSYLVRACHTHFAGAHVFGVSEHATVPPEAFAAAPITPLIADILNAEQMRAAVAEARPDLIFHLAAQSSVAASWADPARTLAINAGGAVHLLEAIRAASLAPRIVLVGSGEQYGVVHPEDNPIMETTAFRPVNPYAVAKVAQDLFGYQYFVAYGLSVVRARPFNHFGPRQEATFVISGFAQQIALIESGQADPVLFVGNLQPQRDFLPVEDVVRAYVALAQRGHPGEAYNIASGQPRSIAEVLERLLSLARVPIRIQEDPSKFRPTEAPLLVGDATHLRTDTGWAPSVDFDVALGETLDYWRAAVARTTHASLP